jgi:23S rRNA (uracil1939-C5)-methyltransferase
MSLVEGQQVELTIEKPAAGGRMIARHLGQVVLVRGAIPGERVKAWVERAEKRMAYAVVREIVEASPDRRAEAPDPLCGGLLYSHIAYERQLAIKSDVVRDAFARLGRHPIERPIDVAGSPEDGYRMRARLHVHGARVGFYREGTHQLCDAGPTKQLRSETVESVRRLAAMLHEAAPDANGSISVTENIAGDERAAHVEVMSGGAPIEPAVVEAALNESGMRNAVTDPLRILTGGRVSDGVLQWHADSFFQGNRFLLPALVAAVADAVPDAGEILDLYAGVGLFSVTLAALGRLEVTAVEGDRASARDLQENARPHEPRLRVQVGRVEDHVARRGRGRPPATIVVDPPRTGLSKEAAEGLPRLGAERIVYVSCDPPTLARDARRLLDAGYVLDSIRAFDLFPNTPHIESLAVFGRVSNS